ncbi:MAG: RIP metalloprotease RseP [Bacilli bacterium]|nr:RIP metalloprotease RseP [Bacilli bacterium]
MAWWQILVGIILFIVALGVLIGIHELGHLSAAKMFHVYCFNYSIGFGPKLISSKRTKKHETIWTLRAIPLGGFVSMYGEGAELDTDEYVPPSRSIEGIARYKRAIIISAGVFLNFILGFILIVIHNGCFPHISFDFPSHLNDKGVYETSMVCSFSDSLKIIGLVDGDQVKAMMDPFAGVFLIDDDVVIDNTHYVLCMSNNVTTTKIDPLVSDSLVAYGQKEINTVIDETINSYSDNRLVSFILANDLSKEKEEVQKEVEAMSKDDKNACYRTEVFNYYDKRDYKFVPDLTKQYNVDKTTPNIEVDLTIYHDDISTTGRIILKNNGSNGFADLGIHLKRHFTQYDFQQTFKSSWDEWCGANTAVFRGLGMLFTGQGEVSGPIGIAQMSTNILANFGFERYLYLWGMISCNLAILNLLPFPGLDGWSLVVIGYEAITKKQIPTKVKGIISVIGLGLLFLLMIFIIIKDIIGLF